MTAFPGLFNYRLKTEFEDFQGLRVEIESLANLNETIDELFVMLERDGKPELLESLCPYFGVVWPSARALSEHLVSLGKSALAGQRVLEIGCGLAVPSLVASRLGATVLATDFHPDIPQFLARNARLNPSPEGGVVEYVHRDWARDGSPLGQFDWVIGSDILYESQHPGPVARSLAAHCAPGGRVVLADPGRPYLQAFADEMKRLGFACEVTARTVRDTPVDKDVFLLELQRR
jgi:predicted nicotinamide N-methyase